MIYARLTGPTLFSAGKEERLFPQGNLLTVERLGDVYAYGVAPAGEERWIAKRCPMEYIKVVTPLEALAKLT